MRRFRAIELVLTVSTVAALEACGSNDGAAPAPDGSSSGGAAASATSSGGTASASTASADVTIHFGTCDSPASCGGALEGTWKYTAACSDLSSQEQKVHQMCSVAVLSAEGALNGTLSFAGGKVQSPASSSATVHVVFPASCVTAGCGIIQTLLATSAPDMTCASSNGGCNCADVITADDISGLGYSTNGNTLTLSNGRTFEYCVNGSTLTYRETTKDADPGIFTLSKQ